MKRNRVRRPRRAKQSFLPNLEPRQIDIERNAAKLRSRLGLSDLEPLDQSKALELIPNCRLWPLRHLPMPIGDLVHFRNEGINFGALAHQAPDGEVAILLNDVHHPNQARVYILEEIFHLLLGHPPDVLRYYSEDGLYRTYQKSKEDEAYGCGVAALVPYAGLEAMLADDHHIERIAEHFLVPTSVIQYRIAATQLGDLVNAKVRQLAFARQWS